MKKILFAILFSPLVCQAQFYVQVDTSSGWLPEPPLALEYLSVITGDPGDTSSLSLGAVAYWSFEEAAGVTAKDSADSYDGTLTNGPTLGETGKSGDCYLFDEPSSQWINLGTSFWDVGLNDLTIRGWIKTRNAIGVGGVMGNFGTAPYFYIRAHPNNYMKCVVNFGGGNIETQTNAYLSLNTWYHFVYRMDRDGNATLYLNNVLQTDVDDISAYSATDLSNSNTMAIGRIGNDLAGYYHDGWIDELYVDSLLWTPAQISEDYNTGTGKFWPFGGIGGDSLNMIALGHDSRADTFRVQAKLSGYPSDEDDGTNIFAYGIADTADYNDTTFTHSLTPKDTTWYILHGSGLDPEDIWAYTFDTVFIDSSNVNPPVQDEGVWDTIFYQDFEQHVTAPLYYTSAYTPPGGLPNLQPPDWNNWTWFDSDHRYPGTWPDGWYLNPNIQDSIVIDPLTGSKVLKESFDDDFLAGYGGQGPARGGDSWRMPLPDAPYSELYVSFNVQFHTNIIWNSGGKLGGGVRSIYEHGEPCPAASGFTCEAMFTPALTGICPAGGLMFYTAWKDMVCPYPDAYFWNDFQPTGDGLQYDESLGAFYFDTSIPQWYNITIRYVVNTYTGTTPNSDAIVEGYVNGRLLAQMTGLSLLSYADRNVGIRDLFWRTFWGGGADPPFDFWFLYDDIYVFTYDVSVDVPRGNELSSPGRVLNLPNWPKE